MTNERVQKSPIQVDSFIPESDCFHRDMSNGAVHVHVHTTAKVADRGFARTCVRVTTRKCAYGCLQNERAKEMPNNTLAVPVMID